MSGIDWTHPVSTRDGRAARLLGRLRTSSIATMAVAVTMTDGNEKVITVSKTGKFGFTEATQSDSHHLDIVNLPKTTKYYFVIKDGAIHSTHQIWFTVKDAAANCRQEHCDGIVCMAITGVRVETSYTPIEGL